MSTPAPSRDVVAGVTKLVERVLTLEHVGERDDLIAGGLIDSLTLVELLFAVEQEFYVVVPLGDLDADSFRSVEAIAVLVTSLRETR